MKKTKNEKGFCKQAKLIWQIFREGFALNPKVTYFEALHGIIEKVQVILDVFLPAVIVNCIIEEKSVTTILLIVLIYAVIFSVAGLIERSSKLFQEANGFKTVNLFRSKINQKSMRVDFVDTESPSTLDALDTAKEALWEFIDVGYVFFNDILGCLISFIAMSYVLSTVDIGVYLVIIVLIIASTLIERKKANKLHDLRAKEASEQRRVHYCSSLLRNLRLGKEIRVFNSGNYLCGKYRSAYSKWIDVRQDQERYMTKWSVLQKILNFCQIMITYAAAIWKYSLGVIPIGSFLIYINAIRELSNTVTGFFNAFIELSQVSNYYEDYKAYMTRKETLRNTSTGKIAPRTIDYIEFRDVSFQYPGQKTYALSHVSLKIHGKDKIALVGENGSGKTTLVKLLMRLYDPTEGVILLNGTDIREFDYDSYLSIYSAVFQDYVMFSYTIRENLCFDHPASDEQLYSLMDNMELADLFNTCANGLDTYLGKEFSEEGIDLSGGQKQKLAICRALYKDGSVVILDEPTASLDPISEHGVYQQVDRFTQGKTEVFISHRMSSTKFCHQILVLEKGVIQEQGTHEELLALRGLYYEMFSKQAKYYISSP